MEEGLLNRLDTTPRVIAQLTAELSDAQLDSYHDGEWTARDILAHFRDDESTVMRMRLVRMLVEDDPLMPDFDERAWAANRSRDRDQKVTLLGDFMLQRQASLNILRRLTPEQWERAGRHEASGPMTVRSWVEHWVEHDETHVEQFERTIGETLAEVMERRAQPEVHEGEE